MDKSELINRYEYKKQSFLECSKNEEIVPLVLEELYRIVQLRHHLEVIHFKY